MAIKKKLENKRYGRLLVIKEVKPKRHPYVEYECLCDCGTTKIIKAGHLTSGRTTSCGCFQRENAANIHKNIMT